MTTKKRCSQCGQATAKKPNGRGYNRLCGSEECRRAAAVGKNYRGKIECELCGRVVARRGSKQRWCLECAPDVTWRSRAKLYGVGKKQWRDMLVEQGGTCALCDRDPTVVDHEHRTGLVRGLLCNRCNVAAGIMDQDSKWIERALAYVGKKSTVGDRQLAVIEITDTPIGFECTIEAPPGSAVEALADQMWEWARQRFVESDEDLH